MKINITILIILACAFCAFGQETGDYNLPKSQSETVRNWLKSFPYYRIAVEKDCDADILTDARTEQLGGYYQPYYVEGDFNRDTIEDFAVALIDKRKSQDKFSVAIFHGMAKGNFSVKPFHHEKGFNLENSGLVKYGYGASRLSVSSLASWHAYVFTFSKGRYTTRYE